jgi:hypothetical protein
LGHYPEVFAMRPLYSTFEIIPMSLALYAAACSSAPDGRSANSGERAGGGAVSESDVPKDGLRLTDNTPDHVAGSYSRNGVALLFDSARTASEMSLSLSSPLSGEIFSVKASRDLHVVSMLGRHTVSLRPAKRRGESPVALDERGDPQAYPEFEATPEFRALPALSAALGRRGLNGRDFPAVLPLHLFAETAARRATFLPKPPEAVRAGVDPSTVSFHLDALSQPIDLATARRIAAWQAAHPSPPSPAYDPCVTEADGRRCCPSPASSDPLDELSCTDITGDDCLGMCGPGCTCWPQICGDCTVHPGCFAHDDLCGYVNSLSWYDYVINPANAALFAACYDPAEAATVVAVNGGCSG